MHLQSSLASLALAFTSTVVAQGSLPDIVAGDAAASATTVLGTASGGALDVAATRPTVGPSPLVAGGPLTIQIKNQYGSPLSIFYGSNAGAPTPVGNPGRGTLGSSTQVLFPSGWAGRITIGKNFDPKGTKIEASLVSNGGYRADVDVSYVDGYSVGITCSCQGKVVAGCNKPLYGLGNTCRSQGPAGVCYNAAVNSPNGPPPAFFAPCR
ncbi:MAG: hypothetical protein M1814_005047, partial [Vezdaea aestivalis]